MAEKKTTKKPSARTRAHAEARSSSRTRRGTVTTKTAGTTPAATTDVRKVKPEDADDPRKLPRPSGPPELIERDEARRAEADQAEKAGLPPNTPMPIR